MHETNVSLSAR